MSRFFFASSGRFRVEVEDTTGSAPDLGEVQMSPLQLSFGELRRTGGEGILPIEETVTLDDPNDEIKSRLTGAFTETDYEVTITGPEGPNGNSFRLDLWPKNQKQTDPISPRQYPDQTQVTFYDGLRRNSESPDGIFDGTGVVGNYSIRTAIQSIFGTAHSNLYVWVGIDVAHSTGGWSGAHGPTGLDFILWPGKAESQFETYWDLLVDLADRYNLRVFQDPFDSGPNGRARWKMIQTHNIGSQADGVTTDNPAFLGTETTETLPTDNIRVSTRALTSEDGQEFQDAIVYKGIEQLDEEQENPEATSLVVNGEEVLRDGFFNFENSNTNEPLYGFTRHGTVGTQRVDLVPADVSGVPNDARYATEGFDVGVRSAYAELEYSFEQTGGASISGFECRLQLIDDSGSVITESVGGKGVGQTLRLDTNQPGDIRVEVIVPYDSDSTIEASWGEASLQLYRSIFSRGNASGSDFQSVTFASDNTGLIEVERGPRPDMILDDVPIVGTTSPPCSRYTDRVTATSGERAAELSIENRLETRPTGTQTLRCVLDRIAGPNTRILIENEGGTVERKMVLNGGRVLSLRDEYTELADIETFYP